MPEPSLDAAALPAPHRDRQPFEIILMLARHPRRLLGIAAGDRVDDRLVAVGDLDRSRPSTSMVMVVLVSICSDCQMLSSRRFPAASMMARWNFTECSIMP